ncbi:sensitivity to high expression protein she9 [Tilletia horrida]|nr:sensitivity to high expression protein she9 [Tilletia horrida]
MVALRFRAPIERLHGFLRVRPSQTSELPCSRRPTHLCGLEDSRSFHRSAPVLRPAQTESEAASRSSEKEAPTSAQKSLLQSALQRLEAERRLAELGAKWSHYSGYASIEQLKAQVLDLETRLNTARALLDSSKNAYVDSVNSRSNSQKAINDLLSRKSSWSDEDLSQYTSLLRSEHAQARSESESQAKYEQAERELQTAFDELVRAVMRRYHEEQIWSDKVRNASSYASLVVAGLNILIFTAAILFVEPYKRRKLAETFEKRLLEGEAQGRALLQQTIETFESRTAQDQQQLRDDVQQGYSRVLHGLGVQPSPMSVSEGQESDDCSKGEMVPLATRLRIGLADQHKREEWAITGGLGAAVGIAATLTFALLMGGRAPHGGPGPAS